MSKPTCKDCRYYLDYDEISGYCGNYHKYARAAHTKAAAKACDKYEPRMTKRDN